MFDWQIAEDVSIVKEVLGDVKRHRPWRSTIPQTVPAPSNVRLEQG